MIARSPDSTAPPPAETAGPSVNGCFLDRLLLIAADRGVAGDRDRLAEQFGITGDGFSLSTVLAVAEALELRARHARVRWEDLPAHTGHLPALLIFRDGATAILDALEDCGASAGPDGDSHRVLLRNEGPPDALTERHLALDATDLGLFWAGDVILPGDPAS
ncbi:hypothetical protein F1188_07350 [Roseospira marina]|uniref:Peptidase C39 domain-containing protein n=1 Tax=Roseospira marina TaxID=140057 RepID=A0A5M6IEN7_9PROT|nr:hypothetical protein [Roseospira marina]KAA5606229.1 hypothetical protein F1188_07350 [Roseospira marina]MBB4314381.1 ABC-type bacteriocin/lantibiotic exporter with double-glycine peptidase domain [Roseospira marina]MBB5087541.1 ABC-type bacteriocin/lantibiotic exporter with double-glycine peptidase domain [Roseospira marina]